MGCRRAPNGLHAVAALSFGTPSRSRADHLTALVMSTALPGLTEVFTDGYINRRLYGLLIELDRLDNAP